MMRRRRNRTRILVVAIVAVTVLSAGYGFTAANTTPSSRAGDGVGAITTYTVSGVDYTLNAADPSRIDVARFNLSTAPIATSEVRARAGAGAWAVCSFAGAAVTCDWPAASEPTVVPGFSLQVVVAD